MGEKQKSIFGSGLWDLDAYNALARAYQESIRRDPKRFHGAGTACPNRYPNGRGGYQICGAHLREVGQIYGLNPPQKRVFCDTCEEEFVQMMV